MGADFLIIGVQKGGTTSMIHHLNLNNDIYVHHKEIHFFDRGNGDIELYNKHFENTNKKIKGEKTPAYIYLRPAIDRIYNYNPNIKLIIVLREPIQRCYSQYNMNRNRNYYHPSYSLLKVLTYDMDVKLEDIQNNGFYLLQRGFYIDQIEYILTKFPRENIYIGISEEFLKDKTKYNEIEKFLGVRENRNIMFNPNIHKGNYDSKLTERELNYLYKIYKPYNERLYKFLGRRIESWESYYKSSGLIKK